MDEHELLFKLLSGLTWHDVTDVENRDPEAVQTFATGHRRRDGKDQLWLMNRYDDGGDEFALVTLIRGEVQKAPVDQDKLRWLWEQINGSIPST